MFSDDEDFSDEALQLPDSPGSMSAGEKNAEEEFRELVCKREKVEKKMNDVDELARQVKFVMELQKTMTDCYSNRISTFPIETVLELRSLSSGSLLIVFSIKNNTANELIDWTISASLTPSTLAESGEGSCSQSITVASLLPGEEFSSELFFPQSHLKLPSIVRLNLKKTFNICNETKCIITELYSEYISLRDLLCPITSVQVSSKEDERSNVIGNFTLRLPCSLVDLLSGCPDDNDPANTIRLLLPKHRFRSVLPGTSTADALLVLDSSQKHRVQMTVTRERTYFIVSVSLRDATIRDRLRQALQLYVIHMTSRILKRPSSNCVSIVGSQTVDELFDSVVSSFST
ncbi:hypothetical protein V3C99_003644 [Haemonchus contortus]